MTTRLVSLPLLLGLAAFSALPATAQDMTIVRVFTEPSGARYTVDGLQYIAPSSFSWPVGSKHVVSIVSPTYSGTPTGGYCETPADSGFVQYDPGCQTRYTFTAWETGGGPSSTGASASQVITADPKLGFVKASFSVQYRVELRFYDRTVSGSSEADCATKANTLGPKPQEQGTGVVFANGTCLDRSGNIWANAGPMTLQAVPFDGYIFRGWSFDVGSRDVAQISAVDVRGPMMITPRFEPAKRVRLYTNPLELRLRIDSTEIHTIDPSNFAVRYPIPGYFDWATGSRHTLGGISPQIDIYNRMWVFKNWSNGGAQDMVLSVDEHANLPLELTANFVRGVPVSFLTEPLGLKLKVEGRDNWPSLNFAWGVGMPYSVSAPAEQTDAKGRKWLFKRWSNNGPAAQEIVPTEDQITTGLRMNAIFEAVPQAVIQSSIPGLKIAVDGAECASPCRLDRASGTVLNVVAPEVVPISEMSRYEFTGWSDGAPAARTLTINSDTHAIVANYRIANRLVTVTDPGEGAVIAAQPASADGFYPAGTSVTLTAEPKPGFRFRRWDGDLSGTFRTGTLSMSMSHVVRALLDKVPYVAPAGVRNAAADLPEPGVAAGLIAIYGGSLANVYQAGPSNPLAQTLGGTVVLVEDRLLPLVYVSPEQINAQLPSDLEPGTYKLTVRTEGIQDVTTTFQVVRNAPGLFVNPVDSIPFAVALHEDGSPVTPGSPAKRTETVTLIGTGFGPYNRRVVDGFATPASPPATVVDPVEVMAGAARIQPLFAGATPGFTGMTTTRVRVGSMDSGNVQIKVLVNGKESNTVILPVE